MTAASNDMSLNAPLTRPLLSQMCLCLLLGWQIFKDRIAIQTSVKLKENLVSLFSCGADCCCPLGTRVPLEISVPINQV